MPNFALAADVKCYHAESVISNYQAKKFGLACDVEQRTSRASIASALRWLDSEEEFSKLIESEQDRIRCVARDLERSVSLSDNMCPPEIEIEDCSSEVNCGLITISEVVDVECEDETQGSVVGTGFQIPPTGTAEASVYQLGIIDKTDERYYTKYEIDRKVSASTKTYLFSHAQTVGTSPAAPLTIPSGAKSGDIIIETYENAILFWKFVTTSWLLEIRHDYPKGRDTRVITGDSSWVSSDDLVIADASTAAIVYSFPVNPANNEVVSLMASNLTFPFSVDRNGKQINGEDADYQFFNTFSQVEFRFVQALNSWITKT